jgi:tetratricopeptide (TPR) repeat protein
MSPYGNIEKQNSDENENISMRTSNEARKKPNITILISIVVILVLILLLFSILITRGGLGDSFLGGIGNKILGIVKDDGGLDNPEQLNVLLDKTRRGDYEGAVEIYNQVINSNPNPGELAYAVRNSAVPRYKATGDMEIYIASIRDMKAVVGDKSVSLRNRIQVLNSLAGSFSQSGEEPLIYQEIYSGEPYSQFVVPGDPIATTRNLYEWGYTAYPTAKAGIAIAGLYVRDVINNPDMNASVRSDYIAKSKQYIVESAALIKREEALQDPESNQLAGYKVWRAFAIGALAYLGEEPYVSQYKNEYKQLESDFSKISNVEALQYKPFGHWMYATFLLLNNSNDKEIVNEVNKSVDFYNNDSNNSVNEFAEYMRNWKDKKEFANDDFMAREVLTLMSLSPKFSDFIENI